MVVELRVSTGEWRAFVADRLPTELDDSIKAHHAKFYLAQQNLSPHELEGILPVSFPMTHQLAEFPGVAKYPIDEWEEAGSPMLTVTGWCVLCMKIAEKDMENLHTIFTCADKLKRKAGEELPLGASKIPRTSGVGASPSQCDASQLSKEVHV